MKKSYDMGKQAYCKGLPREPMKDHTFASYIQTKYSAEHHPKSPGASMDTRGRRKLEEKITEWKRGWDICRGCRDETCTSNGTPKDSCPKE